MPILELSKSKSLKNHCLDMDSGSTTTSEKLIGNEFNVATPENHDQSQTSSFLNFC